MITSLMTLWMIQKEIEDDVIQEPEKEEVDVETEDDLHDAGRR